jgi:hypothetical protein
MPNVHGLGSLHLALAIVLGVTSLGLGFFVAAAAVFGVAFAHGEEDEGRGSGTYKGACAELVQGSLKTK